MGSIVQSQPHTVNKNGNGKGLQRRQRAVMQSNTIFGAALPVYCTSGTGLCLSTVTLVLQDFAQSDRLLNKYPIFFT